MSAMRPQQMQLEFPFMICVVPWDGQYTFTHYLARKCFREAAAKDQQLFATADEEQAVRAWTFVLDTLASPV